MESLTIVCAVLSITINLCRLKDSVWMGHFANRMEKLHFLPPWSIWRLIHHPLFAAAKRRQSRFCRTSDLFIVAFQSILIRSFPLLSIPISNLNFHLHLFKLQTNHLVSKDWTGALCLKNIAGEEKLRETECFIKNQRWWKLWIEVTKVEIFVEHKTKYLPSLQRLFYCGTLRKSNFSSSCFLFDNITWKANIWCRYVAKTSYSLNSNNAVQSKHQGAVCPAVC